MALVFGSFLLILGIGIGRLPFTDHIAERIRDTGGSPRAAGEVSAGARREPAAPPPATAPGPSPSAPAAAVAGGLEDSRDPRSGPTESAAIAIVIDDLGRSLEVLDRLEELGIDLSYSVLPYESRTPEVVSRLRSRGREILLHLPMEAGGDADPGPGALYARMSDRELERRTRAALEAVPGATGVNNHMGSRLSSTPQAMRTVLDTIAESRLFFLDSRTSAESVGFALARELGLETAERHVFLDGDRSPEAIREQFRRLLDRARGGRPAIAIGHPHPETLEVLAEEVPSALAAGYRFVPVSRLLTSRDS